MTWQQLEEKVREIASLRWKCAAHTETIAGVKCDCILRPSAEECVLIEVTKERSIERVRADIAKLNTVKYVQMSNHILCKCYIILDDIPTDSMRAAGQTSNIKVISFDEFQNESPLYAYRPQLPIRLLDSRYAPSNGQYRSSIVLCYDNWNDYCYRTSFNMCYCDSTGSVHDIGSVKIYYYEHDVKRDPINYDRHTMEVMSNHIYQLGSQYCSLGQTLAYYQKLKDLLPNDYWDILTRLNDIAIFDDIQDRFINEHGVITSLLRFSAAEKALYEAKNIISNQTQNGLDISFSYHVTVPYSTLPVTLNFDYKESVDFPFRINVLIGKNGTGKTQILSRLANSLSGYTENPESGMFLGKRPPVDRVMSISYSAFDNFRKPPNQNTNGRAVFSYVYCGIQSEFGTLSLDQLKENLRKAYMQVKARQRKNIWLDILSVLMEDEHRHTVHLIENEKFEEVNLSSGQQILICTITELIANIENESIILFDEPEIHLHPNAISNVFRMFYKLLEKFNSYAIFTTHSPLVLQEVPSRYVQILDRIEDILTIRKPDIECFGNTINNIIRDVFDVSNTESNYKTYLETLTKKKSFQEVLDLFDNRLGFNALVFLKSCYSAEEN